MIRWSYAAPRLVVIVTFCLFAWIAFEPLVRWGLIWTGQSLVGARVDIERFQSALLSGRVQLEGIEVANPKSPRKNLVEASSATLVLDTSALLRRQFVIRDGNLTGLRFSAERDSDGALPGQEVESKPEPEATDDFQQQTLEWLESLGDLLHGQVVPDFESVRVARELAKRWPQEYDAAQHEAEQFRDRVRSLRDTAQRARQRPLENLESIQQTIEQAARVRQDIQHLHQRMQQLQAQVHQDKQNVETARRRDVQRVEESLRIEGLDAEAISQFFLGPEMAPYFSSTLQWLQWAKRYLDLAGDPPRPARSRGTNIEFPRPLMQDFLIERLSVSGQARLDQLPIPFHGQLTGVSSDPAAYGKPAKLDVELEGHLPARLQVVVDTTGLRPVQTLTFDCSQLSLPRRSLGKEEEFTLDVTESKAHAWVQLAVEDQRLEGRIVWKQDGVRLQPTLAARYGGTRASARLRQAVSDVDHVHAVVEISGTIRKPKWKLSTPLGAELAGGIRQAATQELEARRDALVARANLEIAEELAQLDQHLHEKREKAMSYLQVGEELLNEFQQVAGSLNQLAPGMVPQNLLNSDRVPEWVRTTNAGAIPAPSGESFKALNKLLR
jgi:uncharacterized protein (TIGR03545 family)